MVDRTDWRLTNQERYLKGLALSLEPYAPSPGNDHDHCEFCWAKFMMPEWPDTLHSGYTTADHRRWICSTCFEDFRDMFQWTVSATAGPRC